MPQPAKNIELEDENPNMADQITMLKTEIKQLQHKLNIYETAASGANDGLWDWDYVNQQPFVSKPWKTMLGIDENEDVTLNDGLWQSLLHPDDFKETTENFKAFVKGKDEHLSQEFRMRHADGTYRWILSKAKVIRDEQGKGIRVSGSHTDITDRIESTNAIKISEEKYKSLFENTLVGMFHSDFKTGEIIESNEKLWDIFKAKKEDGILTFDFYKNPKDRERVLKSLEKTGKAENVELEVVRGDGKPIWVSFNIIYYPEQGILETVIVDITERKKNILELERVNFELDSFVYHASHDLRSPLRSVLGLIDLYRLEESTKIKDQCIERIESSVKRLDDLVMDLLSISRNDRINDPYTDLNLIVEINNSISSYYNASDTKGLQIIAKVHQPVTFRSDATRLRIILNNVISNAIKYRSFDVDVSIIKIEAKVDETECVLTIEDNGEGIEESKLPHIFDMFYRATVKSVGSGLGLYIVKKVVDKLNAKIEVKSEELEGTTFKVTIPNSKNTDS
jgi:PAS domain S-box-containing protein